MKSSTQQKDSVTKKLQKQLKFPRLRSHLLSLRNWKRKQYIKSASAPYIQKPDIRQLHQNGLQQKLWRQNTNLLRTQRPLYIEDIVTKIIEFWANPLFLSQIKILILFGSRRKLVISVGKRRGFSRRFWLLIKELFRHKKIARDTGKRNRTPYINVSFLEFDFLESHRLLDNPLILPQISI